MLRGISYHARLVVNQSGIVKLTLTFCFCFITNLLAQTRPLGPCSVPQKIFFMKLLSVLRMEVTTMEEYNRPGKIRKHTKKIDASSSHILVGANKSKLL